MQQASSQRKQRLESCETATAQLSNKLQEMQSRLAQQETFRRDLADMIQYLKSSTQLEALKRQAAQVDQEAAQVGQLFQLLA